MGSWAKNPRVGSTNYKLRATSSYSSAQNKTAGPPSVERPSSKLACRGCKPLSRSSALLSVSLAPGVIRRVRTKFTRTLSTRMPGSKRLRQGSLTTTRHTQPAAVMPHRTFHSKVTVKARVTVVQTLGIDVNHCSGLLVSCRMLVAKPGRDNCCELLSDETFALQAKRHWSNEEAPKLRMIAAFLSCSFRLNNLCRCSFCSTCRKKRLRAV